MRIRSSAIALVALLLPGAANATPACDAVRQLVTDADTHFAGLVGRERYRNTYETSLIVPGFTECSIDVASHPNGLTNLAPGRSVDYGCIVRFDVPVPARDFQESMIADMQQCLSLPPVPDRGGASFMISTAPDNRRLRMSMFETGSSGYAVGLNLTRYDFER